MSHSAEEHRTEPATYTAAVTLNDAACELKVSDHRINGGSLSQLVESIGAQYTPTRFFGDAHVGFAYGPFGANTVMINGKPPALWPTFRLRPRTPHPHGRIRRHKQRVVRYSGDAHTASQDCQ
ncbi:hypothetical protein [Rhodococcus sp. NBC_00297]|uniref:hypothetical protein n=1 Tax=Rhodococcus sp. NBC_00297 TaxID=2976005 RepID=UPI002E2968AB|nr:hypothetical protein [Rhodococcus sp. NBC_00297]